MIYGGAQVPLRVTPWLATAAEANGMPKTLAVRHRLALPPPNFQHPRVSRAHEGRIGQGASS